MDNKFQAEQLMNLSKCSGCCNVNTSKKTRRVRRGERFRNINKTSGIENRKKESVEITDDG